MHLKSSSLAAILIPFLTTLTRASPQLLPPNDPNACQTCIIIRSGCIQYCSIAAYNNCVLRSTNSGPCVQCYGKLPDPDDGLPLLPTAEKEKRAAVAGPTTPITQECQRCEQGKRVCATNTNSAVGYVQCNADLAVDQNCVLCQANGCAPVG